MRAADDDQGLSYSIRLASEVGTEAERPPLLSRLSCGVFCVFHRGVVCDARPYGRGTAQFAAGGRRGALTVWVDVLDTSKADDVKSGSRQKEHRDRKKDGHVRQ
ncbi:hypothetical protein [Streptomyces sp. NPDC002078]